MKKGTQHGCIKNPVGKSYWLVCSKLSTKVKALETLHLWLIHVSSALQSASFSMGNQRLPLEPSPCLQTWYKVLCPCLHLSTILSMKSSCWPSTVIGSGGMRAWEGKRLLSFSEKGQTSEVWKTGNMFAWWWDPIIPTPRNPLSIDSFCQMVLDQSLFRRLLHPPSVNHTNHSTLLQIRHPPQLRHEVLVQGLLHYYSELSEHWVFHCTVCIVSSDFYLY